MEYVSIRSVASRLKSQFKVDMDIYDIVMACSDALKLMGLIALDRSIYVAQVSNFCVNMPGGIWKVRGVVRLDTVRDLPITVTIDDIYFPPQLVFTQTDEEVQNPAPILFKANYIPQLKGPFIDYTWKCPCIHFNETDVPVAVETTGLKLDEEKFPMIPEEAFYGCLYYALYVYHQPLFLLKQIDAQTMATVERWKDNKITQANASVLMAALSTNERNNLFDIMSSMDRKSFNLPV